LHPFAFSVGPTTEASERLIRIIRRLEISHLGVLIEAFPAGYPKHPLTAESEREAVRSCAHKSLKHQLVYGPATCSRHIGAK